MQFRPDSRGMQCRPDGKGTQFRPDAEVVKNITGSEGEVKKKWRQ